MKKMFLVGLYIVSSSCAINTDTSTDTRKVPGLVQDTLKVVSGQPFGSSYSDHKSQITVVSYINQDLKCAALQSNLQVEIKGPLPSKQVLAIDSFKKSNISTIIAVAPLGKYTITLVNSAGSRNIKTIAFESTTANDRFDFYFKTCE